MGGHWQGGSIIEQAAACELSSCEVHKEGCGRQCSGCTYRNLHQMTSVTAYRPIWGSVKSAALMCDVLGAIHVSELIAAKHVWTAVHVWT